VSRTGGVQARREGGGGARPAGGGARRARGGQARPQGGGDNVHGVIPSSRAGWLCSRLLFLF
jgi:hypothetical protein